MESATPTDTLRVVDTRARVEQVQSHGTQGFDEAISAHVSAQNARGTCCRSPFRRLFSAVTADRRLAQCPKPKFGRTTVAGCFARTLAASTMIRNGRCRLARDYFFPVTLLITDSVALPEFPAASIAVTVRRLSPFFNSIAETLHDDVPKLAAP